MSVLKSNKGMTLIELIISLIVLSILLPTVTACITSTMRAYVWSKNYSDMCGVISAIDGTVERELTLAEKPVVTGNAISYVKSGSQPRKIETKEVTFDGKTTSVLYINDMPVFDPAFYKGVDVDASFSVDANNIVTVTIMYLGSVGHLSEFAVSRI